MLNIDIRTVWITPPIVPFTRCFKPRPLLQELFDVDENATHVLRRVPIRQLQHLHVCDALHHRTLHTPTTVTTIAQHLLLIKSTADDWHSFFADSINTQTKLTYTSLPSLMWWDILWPLSSLLQSAAYFQKQLLTSADIQADQKKIYCRASHLMIKLKV